MIRKFCSGQLASTVASMAMVTGLAPEVLAVSALSLAWDPSPDLHAASYALYFGEVGADQLNRVDVGNTTQADVNELGSGKTYQFYTTTVDLWGMESEPSNVITFAVPEADRPIEIINGSFESGLAGWGAMGNQRVVSGISTDGSSAIQFNAGQSTPDGAIWQTVPTKSGHLYMLRFDIGAYSEVNNNEQRLEVVFWNGSQSFSQTRSVWAPANGMRWLSQVSVFEASGPSTTITFNDISSVSQDVDLWLDNIQITPLD